MYNVVQIFAIELFSLFVSNFTINASKVNWRRNLTSVSGRYLGKDNEVVTIYEDGFLGAHLRIN